jgi:type I site-specific restriction endonuclease
VAIAEWPTATGPADYALFVGTTLLGVVEAKRQRKSVSAALTQAERYELGFRSQDDYVSKYRRVLEHFDAVKIGLTATPVLHTLQIFRDPVFTYFYREAVIDRAKQSDAPGPP